jgi:hypothetical protein
MLSLVGSPFTKETEQKVENTQNNEKQVNHNGHSYSIGSHELPNAEEIVNKILEQEKNEYQKEMLELESESPFDEFLKKEDSYWQDKEKLYLKIEKWVRENSDKISSWQVAGPLNYGMSLEQMKDVITKKFKKMVFSGNLMTDEQLSKNHNREIFYPTTGRGGNNLTRIWGAEFLKSNLIDDETLKAAEHFLIVEDSASEIEVQVWHGEYPYVSIVSHAHILSQKIEGVGKAWEYRFSGKLDELRYRDFKDPGNIICDSKGRGWVVDTEMKSFDFPKLNRSAHLVQDYLKKRFKVLSGEENSGLYHTFKISVADFK